MPTSAMTALATITLASAQATVTFSSISGAYRDLMLVANYSCTASSMTVVMRLNGDTGANYANVSMAGNGSATNSYSSSGATSWYTVYGLSDTSALSNLQVSLLDYSATDKHKSGLIRWGSTGSGTEAQAIRWANTLAVTSLSVASLSAGIFASGSTFTLYGVSA
jgi:hypothetical protein